MSLKEERENIRWFCPKCGRIDPRHPITKTNELPEYHTPNGQMGTMWTPKEYLCNGVRIPQQFNSISNTWENSP
jgi:hypothetical protein